MNRALHNSSLLPPRFSMAIAIPKAPILGLPFLGSTGPGALWLRIDTFAVNPIGPGMPYQPRVPTFAEAPAGRHGRSQRALRLVSGTFSHKVISTST